MKKVILIIIIIPILAAATWATWYTYNRQTKITQAKQCQYELEHPKPPTMMTAPDGKLAILNSVDDPCMDFIKVLPSLSDIITGHIVFEGIPGRMKVNPYSFADILLGRYTVGPNVSMPCDQSATTTDCSKLAQMNPPAPILEPKSDEIEWREYKNEELGISFSYPSKKSVNQYWGIGGGDTGRSFQATIELESGARIFGYAFTSDYTVGKGAPNVSTEGYIIINGQYYVRTRSKAASVPFVPDEIWKLSNGSEALVIYSKNVDAYADYPDAPLKALINLPGPEFTGIGFVIFNSTGSGMEGPWTRPIPQEDLETFKKIIMSMKFLR